LRTGAGFAPRALTLNGGLGSALPALVTGNGGTERAPGSGVGTLRDADYQDALREGTKVRRLGDPPEWVLERDPPREPEAS
jgi:hypothetical protein